tara:strand:- start:1007 stop:2128 length:1122 start_codon:yes stop_codon:yes gene_type:complete
MIENITQFNTLLKGFDFREPTYRKEVFLNFYEFHLKYKSHPGCVYYMIPSLIKKLKIDRESQYWFCYLNGVTQNICTTLVLYNKFPDYKNINIEELEDWHADNWRKLDYDTDRRYQKGHLVKMVKNYKETVGDSQYWFFKNLVKASDNKYESFDKTWDKVFNDFFMFGRLSTFSYLEYLNISNLHIEPNHLFLDDISGSMSHRNGLCKVLGRDDLDWHKSNNKIKEKEVVHTKKIINELKVFGEKLLFEAKGRFKYKPFIKDVNYFTLESTLCTFKSWFRVNRRYPNVYNDMMYDRIKKAEKSWGNKFDILWKIRDENLPDYLLKEKSVNDPGYSKVKQNWFRNTGEVIMMDQDFKHFENNFNKESQRELCLN